MIPPIRLGDVGGDPPCWQEYGEIPPQGGPSADKEGISEANQWELGIPPSLGRRREI